jgi:hypothetical protein
MCRDIYHPSVPAAALVGALCGVPRKKLELQCMATVSAGKPRRSFRSRRAWRKRSNRVASEAFVFWPGGERENFILDPARLNPKALTNAGNLLRALSLSGSIVRGSLATGRTQTLTCLLSSPTLRDGDAAKIQGVRIAGDGDAPLATVVAYRGRDDAAGRKAALKIVADETSAGTRDIESIFGTGPETPVVAIVGYGAKTDAAVDEAYGIALYLGATMNRDS